MNLKKLLGILFGAALVAVIIGSNTNSFIGGLVFACLLLSAAYLHFYKRANVPILIIVGAITCILLFTILEMMVSLMIAFIGLVVLAVIFGCLYVTRPKAQKNS